MQELTDFIKRTKLIIMGIEEGEEVQAKGMHNIFNKIIRKISQTWRKLCPFKYRKPPVH
jgi:predicted transcriptional regulator